MLVTKKYALSNWEIFQASYAREKLLMNAFVSVLRRSGCTFLLFSMKFSWLLWHHKQHRLPDTLLTVCQISIVALITMSVFLQTKLHPNTVNSGILYTGAMSFALINVLFSGFMPVFYKQQYMFLYPTWAFVLPSYFLLLPLSVFETFTWMISTYWTIGFATEASPQAAISSLRWKLSLWLMHVCNLDSRSVPHLVQPLNFQHVCQAERLFLKYLM